MMLDENDRPVDVSQPTGHAILRALLVTGSSAQEIAEACGVPPPVILEWAIGWYRPDPVSTAVLEQDYNIPARNWKG